MSLIPWQRWLLIHALELRPDGRFRFRTVLVLVARQNGKTTIVEVKNLWKMFVLRVPLVIGTAQNLDISEESWDKAVEIVEGTPELAAEIEHIDRTNGKKALRLVNGSRWKIAAASRKGGRGLSGDDVNLDELREHHTWDAWGAVTKTTMARRKAQIWAFSNAGDDRSVVLNDLQDKGRAVSAGESADSSMGLFEWSAPDDCPVDDPAMWALANPSLGYPQGISVEALRSALETDPEPVFRTECLCQRVPDLLQTRITAAQWAACQDAGSAIESQPRFALDVSPQRSWAAITASGLRGDGLLHVEVTGRDEVADHREGTGWVVPRLVELAARWPDFEVWMIAGSAAMSLKPDIEEAGVKVEVLPATEVTAACGKFFDLATSGVLRHLGQKPLTDAVSNSRQRDVGDGAWAWARRKSAGDITPLYAATVAAWVANKDRDYALLESVW